MHTGGGGGLRGDKSEGNIKELEVCVQYLIN
jgi:hypothetical protein